MKSTPLVTIITAAYNRAEVLRFAIDSVLNQSHDNWQYLIVGDGCTDNTASLVASYNDPRIEFTNLASNSGGQSAPHNHALTKARGDYIFFLNQDDIYFPDHITSSLNFLQHSQADFIWCPVALPSPIGPETPLAQQPIILDGLSTDGRYHPEIFIISSSWAMRAKSADKVGNWKPAQETSLSPSQEWLFRAWKHGLKMHYHPHVSVLCIHSGVRPGSYAARTSPEHDYYFNLLYQQADGTRLVMQRAALTLAHQQAVQKFTGFLPTARSLARRLLTFFGIHPGAIGNRLRFRKHGGFIDWHRKQVMGQSAVLAVRHKLRAGQDNNTPFFVSGWSQPEKTHRWSMARNARLTVSFEGKLSPKRLRIKGRPITPQKVRFHIKGQTTFEHLFSKKCETVDIPLNENVDNPLQLSVEVTETARPDNVYSRSNDPRELGFMMQFLELR